MVFSSLTFAAFFAVVFAVYWATPWPRARVWWLLTASIVFYASWSRQLALLVAATSALDYLLARGMEAFPARRPRRAFLALSLGVNLGLLCYFKYMNFFLDALRASLAAAGSTQSTPVLDVLVPFGISFYTFEAVSYTVDVYRGRIRAERNLANFMLFILFFPHLVAGPIVRARDFLPQAARPKRWSWLRFNYGVQLFVLGLFKKLAISDRMAAYSDLVFADPGRYDTPTVWLGLVAFAVRIYMDFSGYSDMALGAAHCLGYKLTKNFDLPYLSANVSEFWRRWHISLSTWLRDYLFIPLGGSRGSRFQTCRNLMITMTLGGLWHGANWTFVIWGVLHGAFLVAHRLFRDFYGPRPAVRAAVESAAGRGLGWLLTCVCVVLAWCFFQPSLAVATTMLGRLFGRAPGDPFPFARENLYATLALLAVGHLLVSRAWWRPVWDRIPPPVAGVACGAVVILALLLSPAESKQFIYFQF